MKEEIVLKMQGAQDLHWSGSRRPQTAVWRIPKTDNRREKFSKSADEMGHSYEIQTILHNTINIEAVNIVISWSPVYSSSPMFLFDNNNGSHNANLHLFHGMSPGPYKSSNITVHTPPLDNKLPVIHTSVDLPKCNTPVEGPLLCNGIQNCQTYLTSIEIKTPWYIAMLHEKERSLLKLGEEINRLSRYEAECKRKDEIISDMRNEISQLQNKLYQSDQNVTHTEKNASIMEPNGECEKSDSGNYPLSVHFVKEEQHATSAHKDPFLSADISMTEEHKESELMEMDAEILLEENNNAEKIIDATTELSAQDYSNGYLEIPDDLQKKTKQLKEELGNLKKEYEMSKGAISSLQRLVTCHKSQLRKAAFEKETLQKQLKDRGIQLQAMSAKFSNMRDERKHKEMMAVMEKENYNLRELFSELKSEMTKRNQLIVNFKNEVQRLQKEITDYQTQIKKYEDERREIQSKADNLMCSEQHVKVALECMQSRFERFRGKIVQATYSTPGVKYPQAELTDNEILDAMQKIIMERADFHQQLKQKGVKVPSLCTDLSTVTKPASSTRRKAQ
ncbi:coiled-coil domain-containing protein 27 [Bombina bombina]|uniref:coiled-coil domain-containing protein 27 n=1 Tax=Bombina bombina TaxID=8345 RepID=UPI00235A4931|nr:coiled-coil domain-containing protein 27 [Bombina bombina]